MISEQETPGETTDQAPGGGQPIFVGSNPPVMLPNGQYVTSIDFNKMITLFNQQQQQQWQQAAEPPSPRLIPNKSFVTASDFDHRPQYNAQALYTNPMRPGGYMMDAPPPPLSPYDDDECDDDDNGSVYSARPPRRGGKGKKVRFAPPKQRYSSPSEVEDAVTDLESVEEKVADLMRRADLAREHRGGLLATVGMMGLVGVFVFIGLLIPLCLAWQEINWTERHLDYTMDDVDALQQYVALSIFDPCQTKACSMERLTTMFGGELPKEYRHLLEQQAEQYLDTPQPLPPVEQPTMTVV